MLNRTWAPLAAVVATTGFQGTQTSQAPNAAHTFGVFKGRRSCMASTPAVLLPLSAAAATLHCGVYSPLSVRGIRSSVTTSGALHTQVRHSSTSPSESDAPAWVAALKAEAKGSESSISYDIKIFDEMVWRKKTYTFPRDAWNTNQFSTDQKTKLCLGNLEREYTVIGEAFPFPDKADSPVVNEPSTCCRLLWDHSSPVEKVMIQLSDNFPPLLWLTVKPTIAALRKVFREFLEADTLHMKKYLPYYESVQAKIEARAGEKMGENLNTYSMKDQFTEDMRAKDPKELSLDWDHNNTVFLGTTESFREVEDNYMKKNAFVFGWPLLMSEGNHHLDGKPLRCAAFRTIFSKSQILLHSRLDLQLDHRQVSLGSEDEMDIFLDLPVFATINYPENQRLCGGKALIERFNRTMGTSFPSDLPVDVVAALYSRESTIRSQMDVIKELQFLKAASEKVPEIDRVIRLSPDMIGANKILGQLAYTIVYLAIMEHPEWVSLVYEGFKEHQSDMIRVAVAKGAHVLHRADIVEEIIAVEPAGRVKDLLQQTVGMPHAKWGQQDGMQSGDGSTSGVGHTAPVNEYPKSDIQIEESDKKSD